MGEWRCVRILVTMVVGVAALGGGSCGGGSRTAADRREGGSVGDDGGAAGLDGGIAGPDGAGTDAAQCPAAGALIAEPPLRQVALDGGVPLGQYVVALAVARCSYYSRCFGLSTYVANQCVDQLVNNGTFDYTPSGATIGYFHPSAALLQAAAAGVVRYDPQREGQCLAAELAEGCANFSLIEDLPACVGVFTCAPAADGGSGPTDGGAVDGGPSCEQLVAGYNQPLRTCTTDDDCAGVDAGAQGPDCVAGICSRSRCGIFPIAGCSSFAAEGEHCGSNAFSVLNNSVAPDAMCAPGLGCQGRTPDGGPGTCVVPVDVGGVCTDGVNCKPGLVCACGTCEIPPATGPCVDGMCEVGVAYCDRANNVCHPVRPLNASCDDASNSCAPGLTCAFGYSTCQPPS
jgi:hypothetical protein